MDGGIELFECPAGAADGAACADSGYKDVDGAVRVVPDFEGRGAGVCLRVIGIVKLSEDDGSRCFPTDVFSQGDCSCHALLSG